MKVSVFDFMAYGRQSARTLTAHRDLDQRKIDEQFALAKRFFDLPLDEKLRLSLRKNQAAVSFY